MIPVTGVLQKRRRDSLSLSIPSCMHKHTQTNPHVHTHAHAHMYKHTHMHAHMYKHIRTNTHKPEGGRTPVTIEAVRSTHRQERGQGTNQREGRRTKEHGEETCFSKTEGQGI